MDSKILEYYNLTKNNPPSEILLEGMSYITNISNSDSALDVGAGSGRDTKFLLENNFNVTALDSDIKSEVFLQDLSLLFPNKLKVIISKVEDYPLQHYDLIVAYRSLPYIKKDKFNITFQNILSSLNHHGIFVFNLLY